MPRKIAVLDSQVVEVPGLLVVAGNAIVWLVVCPFCEKMHTHPAGTIEKPDIDMKVVEASCDVTKQYQLVYTEGEGGT